MTTIQEKIAIMQAFADGKEVELASKGSAVWYGMAGTPAWNWYRYDYRIKKEKRLVWGIMNTDIPRLSNGDVVATGSKLWFSSKAALLEQYPDTKCQIVSVEIEV